MKFSTFLLVFVCFTVAAISAKSTKWPKCPANPLTGHSSCDHLKPKHCYPPVCGKTQDGNTLWFTNSCYLIAYNKKCHTSYKIAADSYCDPKTKPQSPPPGKEPCGHHGGKPGGFGGHNEFDW